VTYHSNHRRANLQMQAVNGARGLVEKIKKWLCRKHFGQRCPTHCRNGRNPDGTGNVAVTRRARP
jgi:hypothetical protein